VNYKMGKNILSEYSEGRSPNNSPIIGNLIERTEMPLSEEPEQLSATSLKQDLQSSATYVPPGAGLEKTEEKRGKTIAD
jgi:hypothetical protein